MPLRALESTRWIGRNELWLDPLGNEVTTCDCSLEIERDLVRYRWSYEGTPHTGTITVRDSGAEFSDSWHSVKPMACAAVPSSWALIDVFGTYAAGEGPRWGWGITVSYRPDTDELVVQMENVAPWGEHGRAVRMICRRA